MLKHQDKTPIGSLHNVTLELLKSSDEDTFTIAVATKLTYSWICAFAVNRMRNPSVSKVQILYEYLTGKPLKLTR